MAERLAKTNRGYGLDKMKISIIGSEHMAEALTKCLEMMGHTIVPLEDCEVCWIAIDTPVNEEGQGDIKPILQAVQDTKNKLVEGVLVIVSSQIPVGTSEQIIKILGEKFNYAYMPELMKIGAGVSDFMNLTRVVVGISGGDYKDKVSEVFRDKTVVFTNVASAEMIKHANNAFLATSLCFIYDIADLCEATGADVLEVTRALRSDYRIGEEAYLDASAGFSGGHLERDLDYLQKVAKLKGVDMPVINSVIKKNNERRKIIIDKLGNVKGKKIAFWGTTYKPGVPPSENSLPAKLMRDLAKKGASFVSCDSDFGNIKPQDSAEGCMAIICITPWEKLKGVDFKGLSGVMVEPKIFFDARNYFAELRSLIECAGIRYIGVGR